MPEVIDQSGGLYSLASAAGTAQGKARGTTLNGWDAATMAVQPLLANMQAERERRNKQADAERFLDEAFRADPDGMMFGPAEKGYLAGLAHGGSDVKHLSQTAQALLAKRMQAEKDRALMPIKQQGADAATMRAQTGAANAESMGARRAAQTEQGDRGLDLREQGLNQQRDFGVRRADQNDRALDMREEQFNDRQEQGAYQFERRQGESERHNMAGEGLGYDRLNQSGQQFKDRQSQQEDQFSRSFGQKDQQFKDKMDQDASQFDRSMDDRERRTGLVANRPAGGGGADPEEKAFRVELTKAKEDAKEARKHADEFEKENGTRHPWLDRIALDAENRKDQIVRSLAGQIRGRGRTQAAPAASPAVQSTKEAFRAKHGREPDPTNPADVAEMKALHAGGGR